MSEAGKTAAGDPAGTAAPTIKDAANSTSKAADAAKKALPEQNPALRMMGLPRIRLPSRNWMIFLGITGSIASAITYDRWQTRKVKEKWCNLVSHIADEPLPITSLPRTVTIYLSAPPGDGLRAAREHFHNYVKPILVAAAINWDVVEGRKEGDVRFKTAERIRMQRRLGGEGSPLPAEEYTVEDTRKNMGVTKYDGAAGDIVIGRHTWKEYVRGTHEGWLGPVDVPLHVDVAMGNVPAETTGTAVAAAAVGGPADAATSPVIIEADVPSLPVTDEAPAEPIPADKPAEETKEEEKPKPRQPPAYIIPEAYAAASPSRLLPESLEPTAPVSCPHVLGFRNTPIRLYRFLTRRRLADDIGRQVAGAVLGFSREFDVVATSDHSSPSPTEGRIPEQSEVLLHEEKDWWKTVRQPRKEHEESVLIEPMELDDRIISRMRRFELTSSDEQRANAIAAGEQVGTNSA